MPTRSWWEDALSLVREFAAAKGLLVLAHADSEYEKVSLPGTRYVPEDSIAVKGDEVFCQVWDRKYEAYCFENAPTRERVGRLPEAVEDVLPESVLEHVLQPKDAFEWNPLFSERMYRSDAQSIRKRLVADLMAG